MAGIAHCAGEGRKPERAGRVRRTIGIKYGGREVALNGEGREGAQRACARKASFEGGPEIHCAELGLYPVGSGRPHDQAVVWGI